MLRPMVTNETDQYVLRAALAFLADRLAERETLEWALHLTPEDEIERQAILQLLDGPDGQSLVEPWRSAWRLVEESWATPALGHDSGVKTYHFQRRLRAGDRSGALVGAITAAVAPHLKAEPFSDLHLRFSPPPKRPRRVEDLLSVGLTSGRCLDLAVLELGGVAEADFLASLATVLNAAVDNGLDIARRLGWDDKKRPWRLSTLHRVYYVHATDLTAGENEPDRFVKGIAPSVKLLHAVVARLLDLDLPVALMFINRWKATLSSVYMRLWAAMARDARVASAEEVVAFILGLRNEEFWNLHRYPEIAELRARRSAEFTARQQARVVARIRRRPPRKQFSGARDFAELESARLYWALRELRRIELAGAILPEGEKVWMDENLGKFPDLARMTRLSEGFLGGPTARWVAPNPDEAYDAMTGIARLEALERALGSSQGGWEDDPSERAAAWIRHGGNVRKLIDDFEGAPMVSAFPKVWDRFGWAHSPERLETGERSADCGRVFLLLTQLSESTLKGCIAGLAHWFSSWKNELKVIPGALGLWLRLWRIAAEETNSADSASELVPLPSIPSIVEGRQSELDALNAPCGKLVEFFLALCPDLGDVPHPFESWPHLRQLRDAMLSTPGRAGLIARARLIESVGYFLRADRAWTNAYLLTPLRAETAGAFALWRAIAHRRVSGDVLEIVGNVLAERVVDLRLDRETRQMLAFSLVLESLFAYWQSRSPAVPSSRIQQVIRNLEDEVRAHAADTVRRFVSDMSSDTEHGFPPAPDVLFRKAAAPFLKEVWPVERSLVTPGVSRSFSQLPAASGDAFADAVDAVEHFLVPFDCWSMLDYGLYGQDESGAMLSRLDTSAKAEAFIRLLDRTIGTAPGSIVPHDLSDALEQVRKIAPALAEKPAYRRLGTAARRVG